MPAPCLLALFLGIVRYRLYKRDGQCPTLPDCGVRLYMVAKNILFFYTLTRIENLYFIRRHIMKKTLVNWLGLFGLIGLISYILAVIFAPSAYPGFDRLRQPTTALYAVDSPSFALWNQWASLYAIGGLMCVTMLCIAVQGKWNKPIRFGIYLMSGSLWFSSIGSAILRFGVAEGAVSFPSFADGILGIVVISSISVSLMLFMVGGYRKKRFVSLAVPATITAFLLIIVPIFVPAGYSGITSLITNLTMLGFTALLGLYLFMGKLDNDRSITSK